MLVVGWLNLHAPAECLRPATIRIQIADATVDVLSVIIDTHKAANAPKTTILDNLVSSVYHICSVWFVVVAQRPPKDYRLNNSWPVRSLMILHERMSRAASSNSFMNSAYRLLRSPTCLCCNMAALNLATLSIVIRMIRCAPLLSV